MATYIAHIEQAKKNLTFLNEITHTNNFEWQVTVCFYVAVHLINAHLAQKPNQHYRSHGQVDIAINPCNPLSVTKLPADQYLAYYKLQNYSRRARYLIHEDTSNTADFECLTHSKHLSKSIKNLDILLQYFQTSYNVSFEPLEIKCIDLKNKYTSSYFKFI